jgi:hypothetical protein
MSFRRTIAFASACLVASTLSACTDSDTVVAVNLVAEWNLTQLNLVASDGSKSTPLAGQVFHSHVQQDGQTSIDLSLTFPTSETPAELNEDGSVKTPKSVGLVSPQFNQRVILPESWSEGEATIKTDDITLTWTVTADDDTTSTKTDTFTFKPVVFEVKKNAAVAAFVDVKVPVPPPAPEPSASASASAAPSAPAASASAAPSTTAPSASGSAPLSTADAGDASDAGAP